ncbi:HD-GYP domain-containing protein [Thiorhodococcus mannitoliphagus]|uniref:HD-GYP domain-containing protein n=1 Tax=Thiorhodococcus mannitoliphagus TaxID=329406 RepID=A0A6P1E4A7_9GAMM|nr:HD-GYP domain-containing protein [Thiorhodococcus mannitoliphagus]NEX22505.1 HD-GYP domain-containing protein [Thiorhodococcus mannitoliphagus]
MIKKITVEQLQVGMYVQDLNCGWMEHGFLRNRFLVKGDDVLSRIRDIGIRDLYIDTERGLDVSQAPTELEVEEALEQDLVQVVAEEGPPEEHKVSLAEERVQARRIQNEVLGLLSGISADMRQKRPLSLEHVTPLADDLVASVCRNPDALMGYSRVRRLGRYQLEHGVNVSTLMVAFGRTLGLDRDVLSALAIGGLLHDIGKTYLPAALLNKPGQLSESELTQMREHVAHGFRAAVAMPNMPKIALAIIAEHHERMDGSGYPNRRKGEQISRYGQMAAIVDVYDAITSARIYSSKAMEPHEALRKLLEWSSYHFNPELVQHFIRCVGIYPVGTLVRLRSDRLAVVVESSREGPFHPVVRVVMDTQKRYLSIHDIDLSKLTVDSEERILNAELPSRWGIDPIQVLQLPSS